MGIFTRTLLFRWLARWLMRGSPAAIAAKLAAVGALGAWRYHRKRKAEGQGRGRIEAEYEVLAPDRIAPGAHPSGEPVAGPEGSDPQKLDEDPTAFR